MSQMNAGNEKDKNQGNDKDKISFRSPDFDYNHPEKGALNEEVNNTDSRPRIDLTVKAPAIDLTNLSDSDDDDDVDMDRSNDKEEKKQNLENKSIEFIKKMSQKLNEIGIPKKIIENAERFISLVFLYLYDEIILCINDCIFRIYANNDRRNN